MPRDTISLYSIKQNVGISKNAMQIIIGAGVYVPETKYSETFYKLLLGFTHAKQLSSLNKI
jgi:hypothetical protein